LIKILKKLIKKLLQSRPTERRRAARYSADLPASLAAAIASKKIEPVAGRTRTLSEVGMLLSLPSEDDAQDRLIKPGVAFRVLLALPRKTINLAANVVRVEPLDKEDTGKGQLVAVEISNMSSADELAYKEFLNSLR
jgi:c-di-GMP-binding flagellar brake protein YcgR